MRDSVRNAVLALAASVALAVVPSALGQGGITITHAGVAQGHLTAAWQGPFPASGEALIVLPEDPFIEIATRPETGSDGDFFSENVVTVDLLPNGARTWLDSDPLSPPTAAGTFQGYVRVHAWDSWLTWNSYFGAWEGGEAFSPVTPFTLTAVAHRAVVRKGHYVYRRIHGKRHRVWVKPVYKTTYTWADS